MSTLIVPICGKSERYGLNDPKWSLKIRGELMLTASLKYMIWQKLVFGVKSVHAKLVPWFPFSDFEKSPFGLVVFEKQTQSQIETIRDIITTWKVTGPIQIKDCDNQFEPRAITIEDHNKNFIAYSRLQGVIFNPESKSYLELNENNEIVNVVEKKIISDKFCCGLYGFESVEDFMYYSQGCSYVSEVVFKMILDKKVFTGMSVEKYEDWGTLEAFQYYNKLGQDNG